MITKKQFNEKYAANLRKAETGSGVAIIDTTSYEGCTVSGEYSCYPISAWLDCIDSSDVDKYHFSTVIARAEERMATRQNGNHFGTPIFGPTGVYTVR